MTAAWWAKCLLVGAGGGFVGGLLGVGGGIIMVPLLFSIMDLPIRDAKAVSLAIICIVSISGTVKHQRLGWIDWRIVLAAGLTAAVLSWCGAALSERIPRALLIRIFACLLIITGVKYLFTKPSAPAATTAAADAAQIETPEAP